MHRHHGGHRHKIHDCGLLLSLESITVSAKTQLLFLHTGEDRGWQRRPFHGDLGRETLVRELGNIVSLPRPCPTAHSLVTWSTAASHCNRLTDPVISRTSSLINSLSLSPRASECSVVVLSTSMCTAIQGM